MGAPQLEFNLNEDFYHFRQITQVQTEGKGGYLNFSLKIPKCQYPGDFTIQLVFVPAAKEHDNRYNIHPSLFYMKAEKQCTKKGNKKRSTPNQVLKPSCQFVLEKRGQKLWAKNDLNDAPEHKVDVSSAFKEIDNDSYGIMFGHDDPKNPNPNDSSHVKKGIKLNIIRANQKGTRRKKNLPKESDGANCDPIDEFSLESVLRQRLVLADPDLDEKSVEEHCELLWKQYYYSTNQRVAVHMAKIRATISNNSNISYQVDSPMIKNMDDTLTAPLKIEKCLPREGCVEGHHFVYLHMNKEINAQELEVVITDQNDELLISEVNFSGRTKIVPALLKPNENPSEWVDKDVRCELFVRRKLPDAQSKKIPFRYYHHQGDSCVCKIMKDDPFTTEDSRSRIKKRKNKTSSTDSCGEKKLCPTEEYKSLAICPSLTNIGDFSVKPSAEVPDIIFQGEEEVSSPLQSPTFQHLSSEDKSALDEGKKDFEDINCGNDSDKEGSLTPLNELNMDSLIFKKSGGTLSDLQPESGDKMGSMASNPTTLEGDRIVSDGFRPRANYESQISKRSYYITQESVAIKKVDMSGKGPVRPGTDLQRTPAFNQRVLLCALMIIITCLIDMIVDQWPWTQYLFSFIIVCVVSKMARLRLGSLLKFLSSKGTL